MWKLSYSVLLEEEKEVEGEEEGEGTQVTEEDVQTRTLY